MKKKTAPMHSAHMKIPTVLHEALTTLAELEGMTLSELFSQLGREELKKRGVKFEITGEQLSAEIEKRRKAGHALL